MKGSVRKRGTRWYYFFYAAPIDGKRRVIERAGGRTKAEALKALRKALNEYDKSGSIVDESNLSVHDYFEYWFDDYVMRNLKYSTQENYRNILKKHIYPYIGGYRLRSIQPSAVQKVIDSNFEKGLSKKNSLSLKLSLMVPLDVRSFRINTLNKIRHASSLCLSMMSVTKPLKRI